MGPNTFHIGQRWVSSTEAELGLGIISSVENRRVTVSFPAAAESRTYAADSAPLSRFEHSPGETLLTNDDERYKVVDLAQRDGRIVYLTEDASGARHEIDELELESAISLRSPVERLFAGHIDQNAQFDLRARTLEHLERLARSPARGLVGPRIQLLPHQLYIADEVGRRHAPRVLLGDEVGLGKTIESGLIVHKQLLTGRASRVLVVVPENLVHQWLVEMLRRFNLAFTLLDEARCEALIESGHDNPFESTQLAIVSLDLLVDDVGYRALALDAGFDLLVVDEAHHLGWTPGAPSEAYLAVESLCETTRSVLLLTGTPEQLGVEGHFARLRLLDPDRYHDLEAFRAEEAGYGDIAELVAALTDDDFDAARFADLESQLTTYLDERSVRELGAALDGPAHKLATRMDAATDQLLDRHGTGRVLFRNTRRALGGFPRRILEAHALAVPEGLPTAAPLEAQLHPETLLGDGWTGRDSRVAWLADWLAANRDRKVLVIAADTETVIDLEAHLRLREGVRCAAFHEGLTLVARDRAAAYFGDPDERAQALVASEIGSEGRNFQFASDLVLFDLPLDPDLLEQRIGRLDRIGQANDVTIHVPYYENSATQALLRWYHEGANAIERSAPATASLLAEESESLRVAMLGGEASIDAVIERTRTRAAELESALDDGRHRLLERNSFRATRATEVQLEVVEATSAERLADYMGEVFDRFGVDCEPHSADAVVVHEGDHMRVPSFPGLNEDGLTATFSRSRAQLREDMTFLSWEHPMVTGAMDLIAHGEFGNTALCSLRLRALPPGTLLVECVYRLDAPAPAAVQLDRYFDGRSVRVVVDIKRRDLGQALTADRMRQLCRKVPVHAAQAVVRRAAAELKAMVAHTEALAEVRAKPLVEAALARLDAETETELGRLRALAEVNPAIRHDELEASAAAAEMAREYVSRAQVSLDALRVALVVE